MCGKERKREFCEKKEHATDKIVLDGMGQTMEYERRTSVQIKSCSDRKWNVRSLRGVSLGEGERGGHGVRL